MPLDFRTADEEERFSMRRFLRVFVIQAGVFLAFLLIGYYGVAPLIYRWQSGEGILGSRASEGRGNPGTTAIALPKVEIYEKLPAEVVAGTGLTAGSQEVAPFDYEAYQRARERKRKQAQPVETVEEPSLPSDESGEPLVIPEEIPTETSPAPAEPPSEPAPEPTTPPPPEIPTPSPPPQTPSETPTAQTTRYRVQVGVFSNRESANSLVQDLVGNGFEASIVPVQREGRTLYRVQVLVTRDRAKAEQTRQQLESRGFSASIVPVE